jgi:microcystin-dependent protein
MGTRFKVFESTGLAPNGRLYAGDLNQLQDVYADQSNFSQQIDASAYSVGESALKLLRYGPAEARISGAMRIDGIFRGLGGLYAGAFTTAQRDAIAAGLRPYGLVILNTQNNRLEWNAGTDAAPNWQPVSDVTGVVPVGTTIDWPWIHTSLPANYLLPYGQAISRTTYPVLAALAAASAYPHGNGDGSTTFNLPDYRGRVGVGKDDMGGTAAGRITAGGSGIPATTLGASGGVQNYSLATGEMPVHSHGATALTITGSPARTGAAALSGAPAKTGSAALTGAPSMAGSVANGSLSVNAGSLATTSGSLAVSGAFATTTHTHDTAIGSMAVPSSGGIVNPAAPGTYTSGGPSASASPSLSGSPALSGSPSLAGGISNGSLAVGVGTLAVADTIGVNAGSLAVADTIAVNAGTLDVGGTTDNAGSGTAHQNVQPSIVVNKAMRVA